jgi:hypothetical protein
LVVQRRHSFRPQAPTFSGKSKKKPSVKAYPNLKSHKYQAPAPPSLPLSHKPPLKVLEMF